MNDNTAEHLRARELFEEGVKKWPSYSDRTLIRDGHYPDYYGKPVIQGAWEGFKLGLRARADSGEAVAYLCEKLRDRYGDDDKITGEKWLEQKITMDHNEAAMLERDFAWTVHDLYTHPSATAVDVRDAERYRWIREQAGKSPQDFEVVENCAFVSTHGCEHNFDINIDEHMAIESALAKRVEKGNATEVGL